MEGKGNKRQTVGRLGEDVAAEMLIGMGHGILERNYRSGHLEIDIISAAADGIHFVEVKSRRESIQAPPQESVDKAKQRRIARAAGRYLKNLNGATAFGGECHFDIIAVIFTDNHVHKEFIPDAYIPIYL